MGTRCIVLVTDGALNPGENIAQFNLVHDGFFMVNGALPGLPHAVRRHLQLLLLRVGGKASVTKRVTAVMPPNGVSSNVWMHRTLRHLVKTSRVVLLIVGCLHAKANVPGEFVPKKNHWQNPRGFSIPNPKDKAVVVFLHGSVIEKLDDTCDPNGEVPGFSVPEVIRHLAGAEVAGLELVVFAPCDGRATHLGEPLKIDQRVTAIEQTLEELGRAGVDPSRIVLVGQSAGGWAALLHEKRHPGSVNSVIAFAPAFAGKKRWRPDIWQRRHEEQAAEIASAERIPALVFAFENDAYNTPDDLSFLSRIKGTTLLRMPDKAIAGVACEIPFFASSHGQAYRKCFSDTQAEVLLGFLGQHLQRQTVTAPVASHDLIDNPGNTTAQIALSLIYPSAANE
jgi:pimeloyl-ACP methyl ester carboxylesterase